MIGVDSTSIFFQYNNLYLAIFGGVLHWIGIYGLNQMALQRYCSMPTLRDAKAVVLLTVPAAIILSEWSVG